MTEQTSLFTTNPEPQGPDNPRETYRDRLRNKGLGSLLDHEALSFISGTPIEASEKLLKYSDHNLNELARLSIPDLMKIGGITEHQATKILAMFELARRKDRQGAINREKIAGSRDVFEIMRTYLEHEDSEYFYLLCLNRANRLMKVHKISEGGMSGTVADPKKIFNRALQDKASSIILSHNHPSGNTQPSEADIQLTKKLKDAGILLDLPVLDHIIIGGDNYFSFADEGLI